MRRTFAISLGSEQVDDDDDDLQGRKEMSEAGRSVKTRWENTDEGDTNPDSIRVLVVRVPVADEDGDGSHCETRASGTALRATDRQGRTLGGQNDEPVVQVVEREREGPGRVLGRVQA